MINEEVKESIEKLAKTLFGEEDLVKIKALSKAQAVITEVCSSWQNEKSALAKKVKELEEKLNAASPENADGSNNEAKSDEKTEPVEPLKITNVQVFPFKEGPSLGHIKGLASVVLNDSLLIRGLRIMEGENGMFIGYPNDPFYKGEDLRTIVNPITRDLRERIEKAVLSKYTLDIVNQ